MPLAEKSGVEKSLFLLRRVGYQGLPLGENLRKASFHML